MEELNSTSVKMPVPATELEKEFISNDIKNYILAPVNKEIDLEIITSMANTMANEIKSDSQKVLSAKIKMAVLEKMFEIINEQTKTEQSEEIKKPESALLTTNTKIELGTMETGVKWDFSVCGDSTWETLSQKKKEVDTNLKSREEYLKSIKGELTESTNPQEPALKPAKRTFKTSVYVKIR